MQLGVACAALAWNATGPVGEINKIEGILNRIPQSFAGKDCWPSSEPQGGFSPWP
jgi:hypothetical protein